MSISDGQWSTALMIVGSLADVLTTVLGEWRWLHPLMVMMMMMVRAVVEVPEMI
jgi:hypothetical protein